MYDFLEAIAKKKMKKLTQVLKKSLAMGTRSGPPVQNRSNWFLLRYHRASNLPTIRGKITVPIIP